MFNNSAQVERNLPWLLFAVVVIVPLLAWGGRLDWQFGDLSVLSIFPVLGILAWSIMWTHYVTLAVRIVWPEIKRNRLYSKISGHIVLGLLLLHPGLLAFNRLQETDLSLQEGLYSYVDDSLRLFIFFGTISLLTFISYEYFGRARKTPWVQRNWRWISLSQVIAMALIFIHALAIGGITNEPWYELYWVVLGALLIPCFGLTLRHDWRN
ncbi:MAG: hypothetical protein R3313_00775 [Candidatus Saccharimonadales bacterium]|nr:hypothetical protein [Candidatus Saccharimonadales bacterium]